MPLIDLSPHIHLAHNTYCLAYYIKTGAHPDEISHFLLDFKDGREPQTSNWIRLAASTVCGTIKCDFVARALGSQELVSGGGQPLDRLAQALAVSAGAEYLPQLFRKVRKTQKAHLLKTLAARTAEIEGVYFSEGGYAKINGRSILLVDDITTAGNTFRVLIEALCSKYSPARIICFALGKTNRDGSNAHLNASYFRCPALTANPKIAPAPSVVTSKAPVRGLKGPVARPAQVDSRPPQPLTSGQIELIKRIRVLTAPRVPKVEPRKVTPSPTILESVKSVPHPPPKPPIRLAGQPHSPNKKPIPATIRPTATDQPSWKTVSVFLSLVAVFVILVGVKVSQESGVARTIETMTQAKTPPNRAGNLSAKGESKKNDKTDAIEKKLSVISVASVGLRSSPSFESPRTGVLVSQGEKVQVISRGQNTDGPAWVLIRTKLRAEGWIPSNVLQ